MRICVFGAGAVGGHFAVRLARAGHDVSIVARGEHLQAIRAQGLVLQAGEEELRANMAASESAADLGQQDVVLVTLKATSLGGLPGALAPLLSAETSVVFAQNGIPWWYAIDAPPASVAAPDLAWMDPGGELASLRASVLGGVIYSANEVIAPGVVRNNSPGRNRLVVGELDDARSSRVAELRWALEGAGLGSPDIASIREGVWGKLMMNMTSSVLSAVAETPAGELRLVDPAFEALYQRLHLEAVAIACAHCPGFEPPSPMRAGVGHTPSILQDYRRRRPMEIDALVTAPLAFARAADISTPTLDMLGALLTEKATRAGLHRPGRALPV
jgi:2-dehydropantoate 2-reductase